MPVMPRFPLLPLPLLMLPLLMLPMPASAQDRADALSPWAIGIKAGAVFTDDALADDDAGLVGFELRNNFV